MNAAVPSPQASAAPLVPSPMKIHQSECDADWLTVIFIFGAFRINKDFLLGAEAPASGAAKNRKER